jgi:hypothetical protein
MIKAAIGEAHRHQDFIEGGFKKSFSGLRISTNDYFDLSGQRSRIQIVLTNKHNIHIIIGPAAPSNLMLRASNLTVPDVLSNIATTKKLNTPAAGTPIKAGKWSTTNARKLGFFHSWNNRISIEAENKTKVRSAAILARL